MNKKEQKVSNEFKRAALKQKQSLPLEQKVLLTKERIREWYDHYDGEVYVSFSGGKDSTVLLDIVKGMYPDVPAVYCDTGLEYPEVRKFALERANVVVRPQMVFDQVIKEFGYPIVGKEVSLAIRYARKGSKWAIDCLNGVDSNGKEFPYRKQIYGKWKHLVKAPFKIYDQCCRIMKEEPLKKYTKNSKRMPILALMADESRRRRMAWIRQGCNAFDTENPRSMPLSFWTEQDILQYIKTNSLEIAEAYGDVVYEKENTGQISMEGCGSKLCTTGCNRTGCIFCAFGAQVKKKQNRFQALKKTHPRLWEYCVYGGEFVDGVWQPNKSGLGMGFVLDYIGVPYE